MADLGNFFKFDSNCFYIDADCFVAKSYQINHFVRERMERMFSLHYDRQPIFIKSHDGVNFVRSGMLPWIETIQKAFDIPNYKVIFNTVSSIPNYPWLFQELRAFKDAEQIELSEIDQDLSDAKFVGALGSGRWNLYRFCAIFELDRAFPGDTFITHRSTISEFYLNDFKEFEEELAWIKQKKFDIDPTNEIENIKSGSIPYGQAYQAYPTIWNQYQIEMTMETDEFQNQWFTDKVSKCLATGKPFVMLSGQHSLRNLKAIGFKTFDQYIDESYDTCVLPQQRIRAMIDSLKVLYQDPNKQTILAAMQETAKENIEIFKQYVQSKI